VGAYWTHLANSTLYTTTCAQHVWSPDVHREHAASSMWNGFNELTLLFKFGYPDTPGPFSPHAHAMISTLWSPKFVVVISSISMLSQTITAQLLIPPTPSSVSHISESRTARITSESQTPPTAITDRCSITQRNPITHSNCLLFA